MIETIAIIAALGTHYLLLDRRLTKVEINIEWLKCCLKKNGNRKGET